MINLLCLFYYISILVILVVLALLMQKVIQLTMFVARKIIEYTYKTKDIPFIIEDIKCNNRKVAYTVSIIVCLLLIFDFLYYPLRYGFVMGIVNGNIHYVTACLFLVLAVIFMFDFEYVNNHCKLIENEVNTENEDKTIKESECSKAEE